MLKLSSGNQNEDCVCVLKSISPNQSQYCWYVYLSIFIEFSVSIWCVLLHCSTLIILNVFYGEARESNALCNITTLTSTLWLERTRQHFYQGVCRQECSVVRNSLPLLQEPDLSPLLSPWEPDTMLFHDRCGWRQKIFHCWTNLEHSWGCDTADDQPAYTNPMRKR